MMKFLIWLNILKAFFVGGFICLIGQFINDFWTWKGLVKDDAATATSITLIFIGIFLTAINVYSKIGKFAGAGSIVPITGFANSVAAPAIEYKKEGKVFGIGCKIFTIAGPVILYGIFFSWCAGLIYWALKLIHVI